MRKLLCLGNAMALVVLGFALHGATPATKKSAHRKGTKTAVAARKTTGTRTSRASKSGASAHKSSASAHKTSVHKKTTARTASRTSRKGRRTTTTWRNRQLAPTPERYKQIQGALSAKGYLPAEQVNGNWTDASAAALKKFQADQNLDASGKINSLSLIALGLGPQHDTPAAAPKPPATGPSTP